LRSQPGLQFIEDRLGFLLVFSWFSLGAGQRAPRGIFPWLSSSTS
jgi:hypothetical protein